ncbi:hypothetical protein [Peribacillus sp. V2I11]|uniref:hypothetical protein n=1 Tax=Peribacillus sp. V2I11 TaxID=3042277 RepID=UPI002783FB85|nr:hypothetical protein [Peribacillus sp. V2I11]MDQ0883814.1 hypothetical protein [Peribacillus sp. V2I11]
MNMRNMPVIIIHKGDNEYISYSLQQSKLSNLNSDVILIGTPVNQKYCPDNIKYVGIEEFNLSALEFSKTFQKIDKAFTTNEKNECFIPVDEYNLFCYQRWFILRDFMKSNNISQCCYLDSDCMLYTDINNPIYNSIQANWIGIFNINELNKFCLFIQNYFSDKSSLEDLLRFTRGIKHPFVSDMALLWLFNHFPEHKPKLGYFKDAFFDQNIHDHNIYFSGQSPELEMLEGKKKIYLINGALFCKNLLINQYSRVNSLHFQGFDGKGFMKQFYLRNININQNKINYFDYSSCQWRPTE